MFPELLQIIDQALPEDLQREDDGLGQSDSPDDVVGDADDDARPTAATRRENAKRKGRDLHAANRGTKAKAKRTARMREAEEIGGTITDKLVRGMTPLFAGQSSASSKYTEATDKAESESAQLQLRLSQMDAYKTFRADLNKELAEDPSGTSFQARFLKRQLQELEAAMLPPESATSEVQGVDNGDGATEEGAASGAGSDADDAGSISD